MKKLYLLPYDVQEVAYSFNNHNLSNIINSIKDLPFKEILSIDIEDELANGLLEFSDLDFQPCNNNVPEKYYQRQKDFLDNPPEWHYNDGMRIYVIFDINKKCYWCTSANNLNSYFERNPERYLCKAIRVELSREQYISLYGYIDYCIDNF